MIIDDRVKENIVQSLDGVEYIVAIMSGKGGAGKTTISVNFATYLVKNNRVGLMDVDVDCPNVNKFLDITERFSVEDGKIKPIEKFGMKIVSFASL